MARQIDTDAEIDAVRLADQGGDPASPAAGYKLIYAKSGGFYLINSAGTVVGPIKTVATDTIWDAAGDIVYATGADAASKLAIGTAYQMFRTNAGATAPEWVTGGIHLIGTSSPSGTGTVTFSSIPATFTKLVIDIYGRSSKAAVSDEAINLYLNNDTTAANYRRGLINGYGTTVARSQADDAVVGYLPAANAPANSAGQFKIEIQRYADTTFLKQMTSIGSYRFDNSSLYEVNQFYGVEWESTAAVNRVDVVLAAGNYVAGTVVRLYGVL